MDLTKHLRARSFLRCEMLPYNGEGFYYFIVELQDKKSPDDWLTVAEIPLEFKIEAPTAASELPASAPKNPVTR